MKKREKAAARIGSYLFGVMAYWEGYLCRTHSSFRATSRKDLKAITKKRKRKAVSKKETPQCQSNPGKSSAAFVRCEFASNSRANAQTRKRTNAQTHKRFGQWIFLSLYTFSSESAYWSSSSRPIESLRGKGRRDISFSRCNSWFIFDSNWPDMLSRKKCDYTSDSNMCVLHKHDNAYITTYVCTVHDVYVENCSPMVDLLYQNRLLCICRTLFYWIAGRYQMCVCMFM